MNSASGGPAPTPGTLTQLFFEAIEKYDRPNAMQFKANGTWNSISHREVETRARRVALALHAMGLRDGDRVGLLSENRPEWAIADYGCLTARFAIVPIYPTLPAEQITHILANSGATAVFVSNAQQAAKIAQIRAQLPALRQVVSFAAPTPPGADCTLDDVLARGAALETPDAIAAWKRDALSVQPDDLATLIYTSGTTGTPKGVMLSHDNIHSNVAATRKILPFRGDDIELSFLPLSHIFQRKFDYLAWVTGTVICYAESFEAVPSNMVEVRPTVMCAVPRLYEKMYARVIENASRGSAIKRTLFNWARGVADRWTAVTLAGGAPGGLLALQYGIARKLVFSKIHERVGGRLRYFVSGSAALALEIQKFFYGAGLPILEGYGLTETSPVISVNTPENFRMGTVGKPVSGVDVKIADDGEILTRGPNVMKSYYKNDEATRDAFTDDGWFKTGDIGTLEDGFLRITDRKKDLMKTSGGKFLAPQPIENRAKLNPFITEAVLIGEGKKFPSMLIVPTFDKLEQWARSQNITFANRAELVANPSVVAKMNAEAESTFNGLAKFETPQKVALLDREFSIEQGELTPSLKVKRKVIDAHYKAVIDRLYEASAH